MFSLPLVYINGGKRGFLVSITPGDLKRALTVMEVSVGIVPSPGARI
jgi:prolyl-tRNA editing enzyme YbaK/EbsC (Cys-tRNA(Pro) deacylase)